MENINNSAMVNLDCYYYSRGKVSFIMKYDEANVSEFIQNTLDNYRRRRNTSLTVIIRVSTTDDI